MTPFTRSAALSLLLTAGLSAPSHARSHPSETAEETGNSTGRLPAGFVEIRSGCTGAIMEPRPEVSGDFQMNYRKDTLPGLFPVIQHRPRWADAPTEFTLCASKTDISIYAAWVEHRPKYFREDMEAEHRGFLRQAAMTHHQNLPPTERTPEKRAQLLAEVEVAVAAELAEDDAHAKEFSALLRATVAEMKRHEEATGLATGLPDPAYTPLDPLQSF